jgi:hypothetical protein
VCNFTKERKMKRFLMIATTVAAACFPSTVASQFTTTGTPSFFGTFTTPQVVKCPQGVTSVFIECWGNGGLSIGNSTYPTGGAGGGAYASARVNVMPGRDYTITNFVDYVAVVDDGRTLVKAESGKQSLAHNPFGAKGGQAVNSVGTTKFSGGDGGPVFGGIGLNGLVVGPYNCGGGGSGATPLSNGTNGASATATLPGAGGGNGGIGSTQGANAGAGGDASPTVAGGGAGGTGNSARGGKGLCKIS